MSYYSRPYSGDTSLWTAIICFALALLILLGFNTCTASEWNNGKCPDCKVRYELRGIYKGLRYYACPDCGNEVERYGW